MSVRLFSKQKTCLLLFSFSARVISTAIEKGAILTQTLTLLLYDNSS